MKRTALHIRRWKWNKQNEQFISVFITWWGYHSQLETAWFIIMFMWQLCSISGLSTSYLDVCMLMLWQMRLISGLSTSCLHVWWSANFTARSIDSIHEACTTHPIFAHFSESDSITTICVWWLTTLLFTMFSDPVIRVM